MKRKSSRYLGMTGTQIGILAGLSAVALLSIVGVAWFMLQMISMPLGPASQAPVAAPGAATAAPTNRDPSGPALTVTPTPTATLPAVVTIVPPGGWLQFETTGASIWLPDSFAGGDMLKNKEQVRGKVRSLGAYFKRVAEAMKTPPTETVLWMVDTTKDTSTIVTSVIVRHQTLPSETTLEQYVKDYLAEKSQPPTINQTKKLSMLGREARRLTYQERDETLEYTRVDYFIKDEANFWVVSYIVNSNKYFDMLPLIEQSMQTFSLSQ